MVYSPSENVSVLKYTKQLGGLYTTIRDRSTPRQEFRFAADRIIYNLVEEALNLLPTRPKKVITPLGEEFEGAEFEGKICAVPIMRAGLAMANAVEQVCPNIRIGTTLIQRDEETAEPIEHYAKLPRDISKRYVLLLDPMLATGGSAERAINRLMGNGVKEPKIIFVNLISCPEGLQRLEDRCSQIQIVTGVIDKGLNGRKYIVPGLGDFGDRYFGTDEKHTNRRRKRSTVKV